ncbi:MAG: twin-arginine translocation pathway signal protein [Granulosicoccus sp.]
MRENKPPTSRRQFLAIGGSLASAVTLAGCNTSRPEVKLSNAAVGNPDCVLTPARIEGPYYSPVNLVRRDITEGKPGIPLMLKLRVTDAGTCAPITNATVDIWQADAVGLYSQFDEQGDTKDLDLSEETFLRGIQPTDESGVATFDTIYPGWYEGRTIHIHIKIIIDDALIVTSQMFFPEEITQETLKVEEYAGRGDPDTTNESDRFGGSDTGLRLRISGSTEAYVGELTIGINKPA